MSLIRLTGSLACSGRYCTLSSNSLFSAIAKLYLLSAELSLSFISPQRCWRSLTFDCRKISLHLKRSFWQLRLQISSLATSSWHFKQGTYPDFKVVWEGRVYGWSTMSGKLSSTIGGVGIPVKYPHPCTNRYYKKKANLWITIPCFSYFKFQAEDNEWIIFHHYCW